MGKGDQLNEATNVNKQVNIQVQDNSIANINMEANEYLDKLHQAEQTYTGKLFEAEEYRQKARLVMGPDKQLGKFQSLSDWKKERKKELDRLKKRKKEEKKQFGAYSRQLEENFQQFVNGNKDYIEKPMEQTVSHLNTNLGEIYQNDNDFQLFDLAKVQNSEQNSENNDITGLVKLNSMFQKIVKGVDLDPDASVQLMDDYQELVKQGFFKPGDMSPSAKELCNYLSKKGGNQCRIVLLDTIATSLYHRLDSIAAKQPDGFVNFENFKKFYGVKNLIHHAALKAMTSKEWVDYVTMEAQDLTSKLRSERNALVKERLDIIQNGFKDRKTVEEIEGTLVTNEPLKEGKWYIKDSLVDAVKQSFKIKYHDEIGSQDNNTFYRDVYRANRNIKTNLNIVKEIIANGADDLTFGVAELQDKLAKIVSDALKEQMIEEHNKKGEKPEDITREAFEKHIHNVIQASKESFQPYRKRVDFLHKVFPEVSEENIRKLLQKKKQEYLFTEEKVFQQTVYNDVFNYKESVAVMEDKVRTLVSSYNKERVKAYVKEKVGDSLLSGSPALVGILTEHTIRNLRYQGGNYNLAQSEKMVLDACEKYPREYRDTIGNMVRKMMDRRSEEENRDVQQANVTTEKEGEAAKEKRLFTECFARVEKVIQENEASFTAMVKEKSLPRSVWKKLLLAKAEHILSSKDIFDTAIGKLLEIVPVNAARFTLQEYLKDGKEQPEVNEQKEEGGYYEKRLRGEDFLESPIFADFLSEADRSMIYEALKTLISDSNCELKSLKGMEFLKEISTLEQLDAIREGDFLTLVGHLKGNLAAGIERWAGYQGEYQEEIKSRLIQRILVRKVEDAEFDGVIKEVVTAKAEQIETAKKRLDLAFIGEAPKYEKVNYNYLRVKAQEDYKLIQSHDFKPELRNKKFIFSGMAWDYIRKEGVEREVKFYLTGLRNRVNERYLNAKEQPTNEKIVAEMSELYKTDRNQAREYEQKLEKIDLQLKQLKEKSEKKLSENPENEQSIVAAFNKQKSEFKKQREEIEKQQQELDSLVSANSKAIYTMQKAFDQVDKLKGKPGRSTYFNEFLLGGYEDVLFSHGCIGEKAFLLYEDKGNSKNIGYEGFLVNQLERIHNRDVMASLYFESINASLKDEELREQQKAEFMQRVRYFTANMEGGISSDNDTTEEQKKRNLEKFGYATYPELLKDVVERINNGTLTLGGQTEEEKKLAEKKQILMDYEDGLYEPIANYLLSKNEFLNFMTKYDRNSFITYLGDLKKTVGVGMEALKGYGGIARLDSIKKQFIMNNEEMLLTNTEYNQILTAEDWHNKFKQFIETFDNAYVAGRQSIKERTQRKAVGTASKFLMDLFSIGYDHADDELRAKLDVIIALNDGDLSVLYNTATMNAYLKELEKNIAVNLEEYNTWLQKRPFVASAVQKNGNKQFTEEELYELHLRQYVQIKTCIMGKEEFKANLDQFEEEFRAKYEKKKSPVADYKHLDELSKARLAIETEKQRGRDEDKAFDEKMSKLRTIRYNSTPLVAVYGGRKKNKDIKEDSIEKRKSKLEELTQKLKEEEQIEVDSYVVSILAERQLAVNALDDEKALEHLRMLNEAYTLLKQDENLSEQKAKKCLVHFYAGYKDVTDIQSKGNGIQAELERANSVFEDKEKALKEFKDQMGTLSLDISLENEYPDFLEALTVAEYTENLKDFAGLIAERLCYFKSASKVHTEIENWFAVEENAKEFSKEEVVRLRMGLKDYFHAKVLNGGKELDSSQLEEIKKEMAELLADGKKRRFLYESKSDFGKVGSDDLKESERTAAKLDTRQDVQEFILSQKRGIVDRLMRRTNKPIVKAYANLDEDQKKIFALALSLPVSMMAGESLESVKLYEDEKESREVTDQLLSQIEKYIKDEEFDPKLDYGRILHRIQKLDGTLNEDMFKMAMKFTQTIIARKNELKPKDFKLLGDGKRTISLAKQLKIGAPDQSEVFAKTVKACNSIESFQNQMRALAKIDKEIKNDFLTKVENVREDKKALFSDYEESIAERVASLEKVDIVKLVIILQNRSAIDFTTSVPLLDEIAVKETDYANPKLREMLKDQLTEVRDPDRFWQRAEKGLGTEQYENALANLFSYQLRDDITIQPNAITQSDFARNALGRKTHVDWRLLRGALKLLDEINYETTRFHACRMARENVENSYNEAAKKKYAELNLNSEKIESFEKFDDIIMKSSMEAGQEDNEDIAAYVAGFQSLSEDGKILFIKALQNRDILDVSRKNLYSGFFGKGERDYVNPKGRDDLIDEFLEKSTGERTAMMNNAEEFTNAMKSLLSTQIDDTRDFKNIDDYKKLEAGGKWYEAMEYKTKRKTAIDWKLFSRALAFVHRTLDERQMMLGDEELYRSMGDIEKNGNFQFDGKILRKNLHNSGNRYTRTTGRLAFRLAKEFIPGADYINYALGAILSKEEKNAVAKYNFLAEEEEEEEEKEEAKGFMKVKGYVEMGNEYLDTVISNEYASSAITKMTGTEAVIGYGKFATKSIHGAGRAIDAGKMLLDTVQLSNEFGNVYETALKQQKDDQKRLENASKEQTALEKARAEEAFTKNVFLSKNVTENLVRMTASQEVINDFSSIIDQTLSSDLTKQIFFGDDYEEDKALKEQAEGLDTAALIIGEVLTTVRVIIQALKEAQMLRDYFAEPVINEKDKKDKKTPYAAEAIRRKEIATGENSKLSDKQKELVRKMDNIIFDRKANGFEGFDEQADFVALKMVHSILFAASSQNPIAQNRIRGMGILVVLGMKEDIGKQDFETCKKLYSKLMGAELR